MNDMERFKVPVTSSIKDAVRQMDKGGIGFCVCVNDLDNVVGVISDGDFRRAVLNGRNLDDGVENIFNNNFTFVTSDHTKDQLEQIFHSATVQQVPVIDDGVLIDVITAGTYLGIERDAIRKSLNNSVVIMAGGKGKRLDPFTRILPKPLIPLGDEPIIKVIMDEFGKFGMTCFYLSINDKGRMVKAYFHDHDLPYDIQYIEEAKPLGTAGALKEMAGKLESPLFVSNCDVIIRTDYSDLLDFHVRGKYDMTLVASMRHFVIPYGVCDVTKDGDLTSILEKPEYDFLVNTGLYLLEPAVLDLIPGDSYFDMTDLINKLRENNMKVGVFPVSEKSWADVGQWSEYRETMNIFSPGEFSGER